MAGRMTREQIRDKRIHDRALEKAARDLSPEERMARARKALAIAKARRGLNG